MSHGQSECLRKHFITAVPQGIPAWVPQPMTLFPGGLSYSQNHPLLSKPLHLSRLLPFVTSTTSMPPCKVRPRKDWHPCQSLEETGLAPRLEQLCCTSITFLPTQAMQIRFPGPWLHSFPPLFLKIRPQTHYSKVVPSEAYILQRESCSWVTLGH